MINYKSLKFFFSVFFLLMMNVISSAIPLPVDTGGFYRKQLQQLLVERQQKFSSYYQSIEEKNGIFGNKTKKDILRSNKVLIDLAKTDNRIIDVLNHVVDFRNFEKASMTYDIRAHEQHLNNLLNATDTLSKQVIFLKTINDDYKKEHKKLLWTIYLLSIVILIMVAFQIRKKYLKERD